MFKCPHCGRDEQELFNSSYCPYCTKEKDKKILTKDEETVCLNINKTLKNLRLQANSESQFDHIFLEHDVNLYSTKVYLNGQELKCLTSINIEYNICDGALVHMTFVTPWVEVTHKKSS